MSDISDSSKSERSTQLPEDLADAKTPLASRAVALEDSGIVSQAQAAIDEALRHGPMYSEQQISPEGNSTFNGENPYVSPVRTTDSLDDLTTVGEILRYHRQRTGLSLNEVANKLRTRPTTIADIENNKLNNETSASFASNVIARYAILLNLDHDSMVELYMESVRAAVALEEEQQGVKKLHQRRQHNFMRAGLLLVVVGIIGGGVWAFIGDEPTPEELKASVNGSQNLEPLDPNMPLMAQNPAVSGELSLNAANPAAGSTAPAVVIESANPNAPEVQVVDINTARANEQAQALEAEAQKREAAAAAERRALSEAQSADTNSALSLPQDPVPTADGGALIAANVDNGPSLTDSPVTDAHSSAPMTVTAPEAPSIEEQARAAAERLKAAQHGDEAILSDKTATTPAPAEAAAEAKAEAEEAAAAPELKSQLQNVSSQVKIVNRDALGSLNRVSIEVTAPVALKVLDSNRKVLVSGSYKKGEHVSATGIPPLMVQVSDTSAVRISYSGGKLNMPKRQQVQFELPMR